MTGVVAPAAEPLHVAYEEGLLRGELLVSSCARCGVRELPRRESCAHCGGIDFTWVATSGNGSVWSRIEFHRQYLPDFPAPHTIVVVALDDGARAYGRLVAARFDDVAVGDRVEFVPQESGTAGPAFRPAPTHECTEESR